MMPVRRNDDFPLTQVVGVGLTVVALVETYERVERWTSGWFWLTQWAVWAVMGALVFLPMSAVMAYHDAKRGALQPAPSYVAHAFVASFVLGTFMFAVHQARLLALWVWLGLILGAAVVGGYLTSRQGTSGTT